MKGFNFKSFGVKIVLIYGLIFAIMCSGLTFISINFYSGALEDNIGDSLQITAQQTANSIRYWRMTFLEAIDALTEEERFQDIETNKIKLRAMLTSLVEEKGYFDVIVSDINGDGYSARQSSLDISDTIFFQKAIAGEEYVSDPMITDVDRNEASRELTIAFSVPLKSDQGNIIGTITAIRSAEELSNEIQGISYGESGYAIIINKEGKILAHQDFLKVINNENLIEECNNDSSLTKLSELLNSVVAGETGYGDYNYQDAEKYMGYAPIEGSEWSVVIASFQDEIFAQNDALRLTMLFINVGLIIVGIILTIFVSYTIIKPIKKSAELSDTMAKGDFSINVPEKFVKRNDEIGLLSRSVQALIDNMNELIEKIKSASEQVSAGSRQLSDSSMALSQGATEQASAIEELTASVEQIGSQTKANAENAEKANRISSNASKIAVEGNEYMAKMLTAMEEIRISSDNINKIIKVIDDIAFQTNILALNAAVEAARAGQNGKGFAVVAEEVRNLAVRSAKAAEETAALIEGSITKVNEGSKIADQTASILKRIVEGSTRVADLVHDISVASNEQKSGVTQVNQGLMQVSKVVQANSAAAEESAAASEELAGQASTLDEQISKFKLKESGDKEYIMPITEASSDESDDETEEESKSDEEIVISLGDNENDKY